ncbi:MAG: hypothetical protein AAGF23_11675 [Acidobacteriota bacterium]
MRPVLFVLFSSLLPLAPTAAAPLCEDIVSEVPRQGDLECVERWIDVEKSWPTGAKQEARARLEKLRQDAGTSTFAEYYLGLAELIALADNAHTGLSLAAVRKEFGLLPIRTFFFHDGLFIVRATTGHRELVGAQVLSMGGQSPERLMEIMGKYSGGPVEYFKSYPHSVFFSAPALLHAAGVIESPDRLSLDLQMADGERRTVELGVYAGEKQPASYPWRSLHPEPLEGEEDDWVSWPTVSDAQLPWALQEPTRTFRYRHLPDLRLAHIQFRANASTDDEDIEDFLENLERRLKADRPRYLLWDQRWNAGGDLSKTADFSRRLHDWLPKDGLVYVATSQATFSAGLYTAFFPEWADDGRTVVVGSRAGDRERFWSESRDPILLPQSSWRIYYSTAMHDLAEGCDDRARCHLRKKRWKVAVGSFAPDVDIPLASEHIPAGRDAVYEHVVAAIQGDAP